MIYLLPAAIFQLLWAATIVFLIVILMYLLLNVFGYYKTMVANGALSFR